MAQPSTEVQRFRQRVTALADDLAAVGHQAQVISDLGGERFVAAYLVDAAGEPTTDITIGEFMQAYSALARLLGAVTPEARAAIGKLRI